MIPLPASRKSSYNLALPRRPSENRKASQTARDRTTSQRLGLDLELGEGVEEEDEGEEESDEDFGEDDGLTFESRLAMEEDADGMRGGEPGRGLEHTLEKLGFGAYQWRLLALCGFGWMSDNSSLQCVALILPRVQVEFDLTAKVVGLLSASTMAGMMIGAVGWGVISDILGRALPFNSTLFLTAVFGIGASFAPSFGILCLWMFLLGSAVGGSMPTDGTLFLENLPHSKQYLLTLLSVFFSLGAVLSSVVSLIFLPGASCTQFEGCDIDGKANNGWRRVLLVLGCVNLVCSFMRWGLVRLHESPRYLVSNGREDEAVVVLRAIAKFNDEDLNIQCADVRADEQHPGENLADDEEKAQSVQARKSSPLSVPDIDPPSRSDERSPLPPYLAAEVDDSEEGSSSRASSRTRYNSVGVGLPRTPPKKPVRMGSAFYTETPATADKPNEFDSSFADAVESQESPSLPNGHETENGDSANGMKRMASSRSIKGRRKAIDPMGWWEGWVHQTGKLFVPQWRRTVILMWIIWGAMAFAYTMFNVWLPSTLESRAAGNGDEAIRSALSEYVLYSIAGCPGSIVGAWMIQTRLGRRKSLAICTAATGLSTFAFIHVRQDFAVIGSSMVISAAATAMYAVLYGMTPETFGTSIRGTACGTSAALSRLTGVMAPVTAGWLMSISPSVPLYASAAILMATAVCSLMLPFERVSGGRGKGAAMAH